MRHAHVYFLLGVSMAFAIALSLWAAMQLDADVDTMGWITIAEFAIALWLISGFRFRRTMTQIRLSHELRCKWDFGPDRRRQRHGYHRGLVGV